MRVSVLSCLHTRRQKLNGKYPVKIKVIFNREKKFYSTGIDLTKEEFGSLHIKRELKKDFKTVSYFVEKAYAIVDHLKAEFSFKKFEAQFLSKHSTTKKSVDSVTGCLEAYKNMLEIEGRLKSRDSFQTTLNWVLEFSPKKNLRLEDINPDFLIAIDQFMKNKGLSDSSISIYLRNLRTVFNKAISDKIVSNDLYPFGKRKYVAPSARNIKKALPINDIGKLYHYVPCDEQEAQAKDFWFFAYFANGLNIKDICLLRHENIVGDEIQIVREKTKHSRNQNQQKILIFLSEELKSIIQSRGNPTNRKDDFVFDLMPSKTPTAKQTYRAVNQAVKLTNKYMKRIAKKLGLDRIPTTNFARHSYSTVLKRAGVPIEMISENLGHSSIRTTQIYLDSFEKEQRKEVAHYLLAFKKEE